MTDKIISDPHIRRVAVGNLVQAYKLLKDTADLIAGIGDLHPSTKQEDLMTFLSETQTQILKYGGQIADVDGFAPEIIYVDTNEN